MQDKHCNLNSTIWIKFVPENDNLRMRTPAICPSLALQNAHVSSFFNFDGLSAFDCRC